MCSLLKKPIFFYFFTLLILISSCSNLENTSRDPASDEVAQSKDPLWLASLETEQDKLKFLLEIHRQIPELFSDAARFDVDLFGILEDEVKLQKLLRQYPQYLTLWERHQYFEFDIQYIEEGKSKVIETKQITDAAVKAWKDNLKQVLHTFAEKDLEKEILHMLKTAGKNTSMGFLNGLILNLPKDLQKEARELSRVGDSEKLTSYLGKNLAETLISFRSPDYSGGLEKETLLK